MKKIICYLLISNLLISQDNVEIIEEKILPKDDNVIENVNQDSNKEDEDKDILTSPADVEKTPNIKEPLSKSESIELEVIPHTEEVEIENKLECCESDSKSNEVSGLTYFDFT